MPKSYGHRVALSSSRKFMCDLLHFAKQVPGVPMQRHMQLAKLVAARAALPQRVYWSAIFLKAYSIVSADRPELRRSYLNWPWPHLYQHAQNIASFGIERFHEDEEAVFFARIPRPELQSLKELDREIKRLKSAPLDQVPSFRHALLLNKFPLPVRRFLWWLGLSTEGRRRAQFFGTFGISVVASLGAAGLHLLSPLSTTLNYGAFEEDGSLDVRLVYDHRVIDGANVARAMAALEEVLNGEILEELQALAAPPKPRYVRTEFETSSLQAAYSVS